MENWNLQPARDLGMPLKQRFRSLHRESGLIDTTAHIGWWTLVRCYLRVFHRFRIHGREHIPAKPPFVLVANHASHLDALVLASPLPWRLRDRIFPLAAGDTFFEAPTMAAFAATMLNALPVWRGKVGTHALQQLRQRLIEEPCAYILFPEGTRSRDGNMASFKAGLGMLIAGTSVPVVPCYLSGTYEALPPQSRRIRFRPIRLDVGAPLGVENIANDPKGWREISRTAQEAVEALANLGRLGTSPDTSR